MATLLGLTKNFIFALVVFAVSPAHGQPSEVLQGIWNGTCQRSGKTAKASFGLAYVKASNSYSGSLNTVPLAKIAINRNAITFQDGDKAFAGTFASDFNQLTGDLDKGPKAAKCSLSRQFRPNDTMCIVNSTQAETYIWLNSPNGAGGNSAFVLNAGKEVEMQGDHTGTLCFSDHYFKPPQCPARIAQSNYGCQQN